ncbi:MAG TPA: FHA domain-containing protein [Gemmatimonadales bacterium]|nr:FHA domain-containing protein [Gemmatimonadales bacterium]
MPLLELGDRKFSLPVGEVALGSDAACAIPLTGAGVLPRHAMFQGQPDGQVVIRKATPAAEVLINGVRLGAEPTPLLHGDKVEVGGHELTFVDERRSGSTQFVQKVQMPEAMAPVRAPGKPGATANTGGRVVSLTDGREYVITSTSVVFGREAGSDIVVAGKDVSRRHAEIVQTAQGYLLVDSSTNGMFVNDERVQGQRILQRADVIRIGEESFRFYADVMPASAPGPQPGPAAEAPPAVPPQTGAPVRAPAASGPPGPPPGPPGPPASSRPAARVGPLAPAAPPPGAGERLKDTLHGVEDAPRPSPGAPLASLLVKSGALKNQRLPVRTPVFNIGRADYNDIVFPDPSVSTTHAKLQRREGVWVVVDLDSTNGTFVDGERVKGESPLAPGALLRFGDVQLVFEPSDDAVRIAKGGGTQVMKDFRAVAPAPPARPAPRSRPPAKARPGAKRPAAQQPPEQKGKGCRGSAAVLLLAAAGLTAILHRLLA